MVLDFFSTLRLFHGTVDADGTISKWRWDLVHVWWGSKTFQWPELALFRPSSKVRSNLKYFPRLWSSEKKDRSGLGLPTWNLLCVYSGYFEVKNYINKAISFQTNLTTRNGAHYSLSTVRPPSGFNVSTLTHPFYPHPDVFIHHLHFPLKH